MFILKVCHACDRVLGELEVDDLTGAVPDSIMDIVGNVAYTLCPDCLQQLQIEPRHVFH